MPVEEQIVVIYAGVRGYLDKMDPSAITQFEREYVIHIRSAQRDLLETIRVDRKITDETDRKMKEVILNFLAGFQAD